MAKQAGAKGAGAAGKRTAAAGKRAGGGGKKSGAGKKGSGGTAIAAIVVVVVVAGGIALMAFDGNLRGLLDAWPKSAGDATTVDAVMPDAVNGDAPRGDRPPGDDIAEAPADATDPGDADVSAAGDSTDRDDGHWRDRRREDWQDPCWSENGAYPKRPAPENDARLPVNLCDVKMPFPKSVGFDMDQTAGNTGFIELTEGKWQCYEQDQPDGEIWSCGEIHLSDLAWVDLDRDEKQEAVIYFMSNHGGNCESYQIYAYEIAGKVPKFKAVVADNDAYNCVDRSLASVEPYGKHCVKALASCDKNCHACDGTPCYEIFAWTGKRFEVAESWQDANEEYHTPGSVETNAELMKLCGTD